MNKAVWLSVFFLAFFAVNDVQTVSISYPSKKTLEKADHILSLALSGTALGIFAESTCGVSVLGALFMMGVSVVVNGMALKYERAPVSARKLFIPMLGLFGALAKKSETIFYASLLMNGIKNIWDIYSLTRPEQSESIQHHCVKCAS